MFASNSSKGQILRALSNWMVPFDTPICFQSYARFIRSVMMRSKTTRKHISQNVVIYLLPHYDWLLLMIGWRTEG